MHGHVAIIIKTESTYVMIESTLRFDGMKLYQAFSCFSGQLKGHVCGQENGVGDSLGMRLVSIFISIFIRKTHNHFWSAISML